MHKFNCTNLEGIGNFSSFDIFYTDNYYNAKHKIIFFSYLKLRFHPKEKKIWNHEEKVKGGDDRIEKKVGERETREQVKE